MSANRPYIACKTTSVQADDAVTGSQFLNTPAPPARVGRFGRFAGFGTIVELDIRLRRTSFEQSGADTHAVVVAV